MLCILWRFNTLPSAQEECFPNVPSDNISNSASINIFCIDGYINTISLFLLDICFLGKEWRERLCGMLEVLLWGTSKEYSRKESLLYMCDMYLFKKKKTHKHSFSKTMFTYCPLDDFSLISHLITLKIRVLNYSSYCWLLWKRKMDIWYKVINIVSDGLVLLFIII